MTGRRVAITGAGGQLGCELVRAFEAAGNDVLALARPEFDILRVADLTRLTAWRPDIVINSAAWTNVDGCARDPERAMAVNGTAAGEVAAAAAAAGALAVQISTNEVFDGTAAPPYTEDDAPNPINPYGTSKLAGEKMVQAATDGHLIVRTAWLFGSTGENFVTRILAAADAAAARGQPLRVVGDEFGNPTPAAWLANAIATLVVDPDQGGGRKILHLAGSPPTSRYHWAKAALGDSVEIQAIRSDEFQRASRVPRRAVLSVSLAAQLGFATGWEDETHRLAAVHSSGSASLAGEP